MSTKETSPESTNSVASSSQLATVPKAHTDLKQKEYKRPPLTNPYTHVKNYSHQATTVPPFALYGIANNQDSAMQHHKCKYIRHQDPFLVSMNNNWGTLMEVVDNTPAFADGVLYHDTEALKDLPKLEGKWGGDERLKHYLNNEGPPPEKGKLAFHDLNSDSSSETKDYFKRRSKAGYWMSTEKREEWLPYFKRVFLYNNYIPLCFRVVLICLCVITLGIAIRIFKISKRQYYVTSGITSSVSQQPSTIMAICVQTIALVYLGYITYDEFSSKPLGIRNPVEKMRLILLDLLFIIFSSSNLSLSFNTLYDDRWVCVADEESSSPRVGIICRLQRSQCAFLFVILCTWVVTFVISIIRVIQKVSSPGAMS